MAMSARVNRMNGRIIGEKRGGVTRRFSHDPQGNTIAAYDSSGNLTDTFVYWPYGEVRVRTGSSTIPYQYSGAWGSYTDSSGRNYNVARYLRKDYGQWMTVDPLWSDEYPYAYADGSPASTIDPTGLSPQVIGCAGCLICVGFRWEDCWAKNKGDIPGFIDCLAFGMPWYCDIACDLCFGGLNKLRRCARAFPRTVPAKVPPPKFDKPPKGGPPPKGSPPGKGKGGDKCQELNKKYKSICNPIERPGSKRQDCHSGMTCTQIEQLYLKWLACRHGRVWFALLCKKRPWADKGHNDAIRSATNALKNCKKVYEDKVDPKCPKSQIITGIWIEGPPNGAP